MLVTGDYRDQMEAIGFHLSPDAKFLGYTIDGRLVSLAAFDNYNGTNIDVHIWAEKITPKWLRGIARYVFEVCGCRRMTSLNDSDNFQMKPYLERLGFQYEGTIRHGLPDSDLIVYGLIEEDCTWARKRQR